MNLINDKLEIETLFIAAKDGISLRAVGSTNRRPLRYYKHQASSNQHRGVTPQA